MLGAISFFYAGPIGVNMKIVRVSYFAICLLFAIALVDSLQLNAQNLTLEGQTGGFITPTAYVVYSAKSTSSLTLQSAITL